MFCMRTKLGIFLGQSAVHIVSMATPPLWPSHHIQLAPNMPAESLAKPSQVVGVTLDMPDSGRYIAVADSVKNVYLFKFVKETCKFIKISSWVMPHRVIKIKIGGDDEDYIVTLDKVGDIFLNLIGEKDVISKTRKLMGHSSLVMDMAITRDLSSLITCDRDEKIRISCFPLSFQIKDYALGHQAAVVNLDLLDDDEKMISASADGVVKLWQLDTCDLSKHGEICSWNVFEVLHMKMDSGHNLRRMKAMEYKGRTFIIVLLVGREAVTVFELMDSLTLRLCMSEILHHDIVDIFCLNKLIFVHYPVIGVLKKYSVLSFEEELMLPYFEFKFDDETLKDILAYGAAYNPSMAPLLKRPLQPEPGPGPSHISPSAT